MSKNGDVVWADGMAWQRDEELDEGDKNWWVSPTADPMVKVSTLKYLKAFKDFRWLVKDGELVDHDLVSRIRKQKRSMLAYQMTIKELLDQLKDARSQRNQWANEATRHWLNTDEPSLKDRWRRAWGEGHDCGVECGTGDERAAIVEWLRGIWPTCYARDYADDIERGEHLQDAPTEPKGPCGEVPGFACFCCEPKGHEGAHVCGCSTVPHAIGESDE